MIKVNQLSFSFARRQLFDALDFTINQGEILSIIGSNGCGKSTLLRLLRGKLKPQRGEIRWDDIAVTDIPALTLARKVAVVPQTVHVDFPYKVREVVAMGRYPHRKSLLSFSDHSDLKAVRHALAVTDIASLSERIVTQLSGGELQRVFLARALAQSAEVLFLDEATSHLDIDHRLELSELLLRLNREQGTTIVQVSHDLDMAAAMSQRIMLLSEHGEIISIDSAGKVLTAENLKQAFRVDVKVETNPLTGAPLILPLLNNSLHQLEHLKIHLICGGGSGKTLLRKLHMAGSRITTGPLNTGDADEIQATALMIPCATEQPFCPYSETALSASAKMIADVNVVIVATRWWGSGNIDCLHLAENALKQGKKIYLFSPHNGQDFSAGQAQKELDQLIACGAQMIESEEKLLNSLDEINFTVPPT